MPLLVLLHLTVHSAHTAPVQVSGSNVVSCILYVCSMIKLITVFDHCFCRPVCCAEAVSRIEFAYNFISNTWTYGLINSL